MVAIKGKKEKKAVTAKPLKEGNRVSKKKDTALLGAKKLKKIVELTEKQSTPVVEQVKQLKKNEKVENKIKVKKNKHHIQNLDGVEMITVNKGSKLGKEKTIKPANGWEVSSLEKAKSQDKGKKNKKKNANVVDKNGKFPDKQNESAMEKVKLMKEGSESKPKNHAKEDKLEKKNQEENAEIKNGKHDHLEGKDVLSVEGNIRKKGKSKAEKKRKKSESSVDHDVSSPDKDEPRNEGKKIRMEKQIVSEDQLDEEKENQADPVQESGGRKKRGKWKDCSSDINKKKKPTYRASLIYEDLVEGQLMMGCIQKIDSLQLVISLPHGALGTVVITRICNAYTELLQKFTEEDDNENSSIEIKPLQNLFTVGNHVVVRIVEVLKEGAKAKVSLSLKPEDVNSDLSVSSLKVGHVLQCVVSGIDSKGFVIDTGIPGVSRAFLPKKSAEETDVLDIGSTLRCIVTKIQGTKAKGTISLTVSADSKAVRDATLTVDSATDISLLVPGTAVDTTISKVHKDRLDLDLANFQGVVSRKHLKLFDTLDCYQERMKVRARVLYKLPEKKMVHFTFQEHVCLDSSEMSSLKAGDEIQNAEVFESGSLGVFLKLTENCLGFIPVNEDSNANEFSVGSQRCCNIVNYLPMDNLYNVNCKKEKTTMLLRVKVNAIVKKIKEDSIIVTLKKPSIDANIPLYHLHDNASKWDEVKSSFRVGDDVHGAVVISVANNLVTLTLKESIKSWVTKTRLTQQLSLTKSLHYPAIVRKVLPHGLSVEMPVGVHGAYGVIRSSKLKDIWHLRNSISEGTIIWIIYGGVDDKKRKILLYAKDRNDIKEILQNKDCKVRNTQEEKTEVATIDTDASGKKRKCEDTENQVESKKLKDAEKTKACYDSFMSQGLLAQTVLGCIQKIENDKMHISLPHGNSGTVPATKICNAYTELKKLTNQENDEKAAKITSLQDLFPISKPVIVKVEGDQNEESNKTVSFSLKPEDVNSKLSASSLKVGHVLPCAVSEVEEKGFVIDTGIVGVNRAFLPIKAAEGAGIVGVGSLLKCVVTKIQGDKAKGAVKLTLSANPKTINNATSPGDLLDVSLLVPGTAVNATVSKIQDDGLELGFGSCKAFVNYTHLKGLFDTLECYKEGMNVKAWVLFVSRETKIVHCTLQDSIFSRSADGTVFPGVKPGEEVKEAEVYGSSKVGVFLKLNETCRAYCKLSNHDNMDAFAIGTKKDCIIVKYSLLDNLYTVNFKKDKQKLFIRSQVNGVIKEIQEDAIIVTLKDQFVDAKIPVYHLHDEVNKFDEIKSSLKVGDDIQDAIIFSNKNGITLTLKKSIKSWIASSSHDDQMVLAEKVRYPGVVEDVRQYGIMFAVPVGVNGYHGLLHKSQLINIWQRKNSISVGATVWVKYKGVDARGRPSVVYANNKKETQNMLQLHSSKDGNKNGTLDTKQKETENEETNEEGNEDKEDNDEGEKESKRKSSQPKQCLTVGGGFVWDVPDTAAEKEESSDSEDEEDGEAQKKKAKKLTKAEQIALAKQEEQRLFELERARLDKDRVPENAMDYEELLQMSPNSSAVWIKYISYHLESAEVEKAKSIARRALTVINMSEERERLNIWTVILRLEVLYGTSESTEAAFKEALLGNDSRKIHEAMAMVYAESEKTEEAGKVYHAMTKKFGKDINVWIKVAVFYYQNQKLEQGRHLLERALLPLGKKDHVELISRFAQLEFKFGEPERGKSMFESLISNHPKRIDIWSVYIDVLTKNGNIEGARDVLGRMMGLNLRMNKMRAIFKKCLDFESVHGTPETVKAVKTQVEEYLSGTLGSS